MIYQRVLGLSLTLLLMEQATALIGNLFQPTVVAPPVDVKLLASNLADTRISICLDVGRVNDLGTHMPQDWARETRLMLKDMVVVLKCDAADNACVGLPGSLGPHPQLSSGAHKLQFQNLPKVITMAGEQEVDFRDGAWELVWRDDALAGTVIVGFEAPSGAQRGNADATIPPGRCYLSFACWRPEALAEARAKLAHANAREEQAQDEYTKSIESFQSIPLRWDKAVSKALAFRKACQSQEKIHHSSIARSFYREMVPQEEEVVTFSDSLVLCSTGTIWMPMGRFNGRDHVLLGTCGLTPCPKDSA